MIRVGLFALVAVGVPIPAQAQEEAIDCNDPVTQFEMNECAYRDWQAADANLNEAYGFAIAHAQRIDTSAAMTGDTRDTGTEEMLRRAQRAWITFRDAACSVESDIALGGSMQPMLYSGCMTALTRRRAEDLRYFGEFN